MHKGHGLTKRTKERRKIKKEIQEVKGREKEKENRHKNIQIERW